MAKTSRVSALLVVSLRTGDHAAVSSKMIQACSNYYGGSIEEFLRNGHLLMDNYRKLRAYYNENISKFDVNLILFTIDENQRISIQAVDAVDFMNGEPLKVNDPFLSCVDFINVSGVKALLRMSLFESYDGSVTIKPVYLRQGTKRFDMDVKVPAKALDLLPLHDYTTTDRSLVLLKNLPLGDDLEIKEILKDIICRELEMYSNSISA